MQRVMIWLAPITVLGFVVLLALMYGWVGEMNNAGLEAGERPEREANQAVQFQALPRMGGETAKQETQGQQKENLAHQLGPKFPAGIGNQQMQLVEQPLDAGIGSGQIRLARQPAPGVNPGTNPAMQADPTGQGFQSGQPAHQEGLQFPAGIGNQPMQLIDQTFPVGLGGGQIQLMTQNIYLGLNLSELTQDLAGQLNAASPAGLYVTGVVPTSPAERAGLKVGDVLIECDGTPVNTIKTAAQIFGQKKVGQSIQLVVKRNGATKSFRARMANVPMGLEVGGGGKAAWVGADVQSIDAVMKIRFNLQDQQGVIVTHVAPNSPATAADLQVGDVIRRVGETRLRGVAQLESLVHKSQPGQKLSLAIIRNGQPHALTLTLGRKNAPSTENVAVLPAGDLAIEGSWIGMDVTELSPADVSDMGLPVNTKGILVSDVEGPPATVAGFQTGDVIIGVNGTPTLDMKQFVAATQRQAGAVVDVIRGNRHVFVSVAPPGYTVQGTPLNTGLDKRFRQVALERPVPERFAICTMGPHLNSPLAAYTAGPLSIVLVDPGNNTFAVLQATDSNQLPDILSQNRVSSLICTNIAPQVAKTLACRGIKVYNGVVGSAADAITLYQTGSLMAMRGF